MRCLTKKQSLSKEKDCSFYRLPQNFLVLLILKQLLACEIFDATNNYMKELIHQNSYVIYFEVPFQIFVIPAWCWLIILWPNSDKLTSFLYTGARNILTRFSFWLFKLMIYFIFFSDLVEVVIKSRAFLYTGLEIFWPDLVAP